MVRRRHPDFHKSMMTEETYPQASRRVKYEETPHSYLYRTGDHLYKIRKPDPIYSNLAIKERYTQEALNLGRLWGGDIAVGVLPLVKQGEAYTLGGDGEVVDYVLQLVQLSDHYWLTRQLANHKVTPTAIGRLARFLAERHAEAALEEKAADAGRPEHFRMLMEEILYQCKKYVPLTVTEPMLDVIARPVNHFIDDARKLFTRRMKRGRIVNGHGAFVPEHIYMKSREIHAVAPLDSQPKYRLLDAAADVASLVNALYMVEADELADVFVKRYATSAKDRDLTRLLPAYRTFQAARMGLRLSESMADLPEDDPERKDKIAEAHSYFNIAVTTARQIPKEF